MSKKSGPKFFLPPLPPPIVHFCRSATSYYTDPGSPHELLLRGPSRLAVSSERTTVGDYNSM